MARKPGLEVRVLEITRLSLKSPEQEIDGLKVKFGLRNKQEVPLFVANKIVNYDYDPQRSMMSLSTVPAPLAPTHHVFKAPLPPVREVMPSDECMLECFFPRVGKQVTVEKGQVVLREVAFQEATSLTLVVGTSLKRPLIDRSESAVEQVEQFRTWATEEVAAEFSCDFHDNPRLEPL